MLEWTVNIHLSVGKNENSKVMFVSLYRPSSAYCRVVRNNPAIVVEDLPFVVMNRQTFIYRQLSCSLLFPVSMNRLAVYSYLTRCTHWEERFSKGLQNLCQEWKRPRVARLEPWWRFRTTDTGQIKPRQNNNDGQRTNPRLPFQDLTSGWIQPESDNYHDCPAGCQQQLHWT